MLWFMPQHFSLSQILLFQNQCRIFLVFIHEHSGIRAQGIYHTAFPFGIFNYCYNKLTTYSAPFYVCIGVGNAYCLFCFLVFNSAHFIAVFLCTKEILFWDVMNCYHNIYIVCE